MTNKTIVNVIILYISLINVAVLFGTKLNEMAASKIFTLIITVITTSFLFYRKNKLAASIVEFSILFTIFGLLFEFFSILDFINISNGMLIFLVIGMILLSYYRFLNGNISKEITNYFIKNNTNTKIKFVENMILVFVYCFLCCL